MSKKFDVKKNYVKKNPKKLGKESSLRNYDFIRNLKLPILVQYYFI